MATKTTARPTLGDYMSLICFHYLRQGTEDIAGRAAIVAAGRNRGSDLCESLGLNGATSDGAVMTEKLYDALGEAGTRLCLVDSVTQQPDGSYEVHIHEGACTAGVQSAVPYCAFTMGVFVGAISAMTNTRMLGREQTCEAMNGKECVYLIEPV